MDYQKKQPADLYYSVDTAIDVAFFDACPKKQGKD
jgi:hypothetical protein